MGLRIFCWVHVNSFEDNDSISYLNTSISLLSNNWKQTDADATLLYPALIAFFHVLGLGVETAARSVSFVSAIALFFVVYLIGKKIAGTKEVLIALALLAFNPFLINLSVSVLSEPLYIALIYIGFLLLQNFVSQPTVLKGLLLGIVFGLSFIDRTEGIIFLVVIPLVMVVYFIFRWKNNYTASKVILWLSLFIVGFSILAAPTILRVSEKMGSFSINGRTAWMKILKNQDGKTYDQKIYGLDYSPREINLYYLQTHPKDLNNITTLKRADSDLANYATMFYKQFQILIGYRLIELLGFFVIIFGGIGFYHLIYNKELSSIFLIVTLLAAVLVPPLLHNVVLRHIAIIVPIILLLGGIGINRVSIIVENFFPNERLEKILQGRVHLIIIGLIIFVSLGQLHASLLHPSQDVDYNPNSYVGPLKTIHREIKKSEIHKPKILSRKSFFPYMAGAQRLSIPYADYDKLVKYCKLNNADYLFLNYSLVQNFPFLNVFNKGYLEDFKLLYSRISPNGEKIELYKFISNLESK